MAALSSIIGGLCVATGFGYASRYLHRRYLFHGHTYRQESTILETDQWIQSDQESLHLRTLPTTNPKKQRHIILYCHGNAGNLDDWTQIVQPLRCFGDVCIFDYRGYGCSSGRPTAQGILTDGESILNAVFQSRFYREITVYGRSLGCIVATHIANHPRITRLVLETPLIDIKEVIPRAYALPYRAGIVPSLEILPKLRKINENQTKIHIVVATQDEVIPYASSYNLLCNYDFHNVLCVECGHNDVMEHVPYQIWIRHVFL